MCCGMSVHCVLEYLLLDHMGWWAPVCCGMSVHCVLEYLLLDHMGGGVFFMGSALMA